jgi:hypothetical protein
MVTCPKWLLSKNIHVKETGTSVITSWTTWIRSISLHFKEEFMIKYIYESPDKGKTVYRYPIGHPDKRELVKKEPDVLVSDDGTVTIYE